jgi:sugar lactone lactonase YvrE
MGGQQPVQNSAVQLFAAGSTGYGTGAQALGTKVYTDQNGNFSITDDFTCPSNNALTYLVSNGGDPGTGADNSAIALMATLGSCGDLSSISFVVIDEVTTVASVWALAPFLGPGEQIGTSSTNSQGLVNAFAAVDNLVDISKGTAPGTGAPEGAVLPVSKINTLANIVAACVNSTGSSVCDALFSAATPAGGSAPANVLDAALNIARNPGANVAALFAMPTPSAPFQPSLSIAPADWTLAVSYKGGGLDSPGSIAVDASGNVWTANYFSSVTELSSTGEPLSPSSGFTGGGLDESYGIAVDENGSVWVTNQESPGVNSGHGSLTVLNSSGQVISSAGGYYGGGVFFPVGIATDTDGSVWTANYGNSTASRLSDTGAAISGSEGFGVGNLSGPVAVAIDAAHNAWFADQSADSGSVTSISPAGTQVTTTVCCGEQPSGIATDGIGISSNVSKGHVWTTNHMSGTVSELELANTGSVVVVSTGYSGGGLDGPNGIAIDGAGNVWVTNFEGNSITELEGANSATPGAAVSPSSGFGTDANLGRPYGIAIDASGNLWVSNFGLSTITQFLGAATPVKTPLAGPPQLP